MKKLIVLLVTLLPMTTFAETTEILGINKNYISLSVLGIVFILLMRPTNTKDKK